MNDLLARCVTFFQKQRLEAYLVGGAVRDMLLGRECHDLDFAVPREALQVARELANALGGAYYPLDEERETGRIVMPDRNVVDVALLRGDHIEADLAARDFTINAMALPPLLAAYHLPQLNIIDPLNGVSDLRARLLRVVSDQTFVNDPLRLLRAVRIAGELNFTIEAYTESLIRRDAALLAQASGERVREELLNILVAVHTYQTLEQLQRVSYFHAN